MRLVCTIYQDLVSEHEGVGVQLSNGELAQYGQGPGVVVTLQKQESLAAELERWLSRA